MKLVGENELEAVLQRLDRLTQEEARMTVASTLEVAHGLFDNLKVVMDGGQYYSRRYQMIDKMCSHRRQSIDGWHTTSSA